MNKFSYRAACFTQMRAEYDARNAGRPHTEIRFIAGSLYARIVHNLRNMDKMQFKGCPKTPTPL